MSNEIMLGVPFDASKITYPVEVSIKLDGVAADFYSTPNGWVCQSRQGKPLPSTTYIIDVLNKHFKGAEINTHIVGELTVMGVPTFKEAAGIIRRKQADERIQLNVYDMYVVGKENEIYDHRLLRIKDLLQAVGNKDRRSIGNVEFSLIKKVPTAAIALNIEELQEHLESAPKMMQATPMYEGYMIRCLKGPDSRYKIGKRSRNMMKFKPKPTLDLKIVGFEEATANKDSSFLGDSYIKGQGLSAVGRIIALYKGTEIGVGPGTLTHVERRTLWERYVKAGKPDLRDRNLIAEVEYMLDDSYDALRQAVFKRWRLEKEEENERY